VTTTIVRFDRELRRLDPEDAEAWRAWLIQHQLNGLDIACPSQLIYREATKRKLATLQIELLTRDKLGSFRSTKTITFSGPLMPFPSGYRVEELVAGSRSNGRRRRALVETGALVAKQAVCDAGAVTLGADGQPYRGGQCTGCKMSGQRDKKITVR
jgi:hypothetical protein